jgi:glycosyltransferase involved in cell wall biosynthesis
MADAKKRVLFITPQPFFQWRGSPIRVAFDVRALAELGYEVDLLCLPVGMDADLPETVRVIRTPNLFRRENFPIGPSFWKAIYDIILFFHAAVLVARNKYDVLHGVEDAGVIAGVMGKLFHKHIVFEKHSDPMSYKKGLLRSFVLWVYRGMERFSMRCADAIIGTGPGLVKQAEAAQPDTPAWHIFDIPSSLAEADAEKSAALRKELQQGEHELLVMYVGSFAVYQGIDLMFEAIPLAAKQSANVRFVIIGGSEQEIEERTAQMTRYEAVQSVTFVGKVPPDDLPSYLTAADILLSPRTSGTNTPLKLLDYLKAGRAIVAADSPANRLILDETTALLVKAEGSAFARGIVHLLDDPAKRERLAEKGHALIENLYNFGEFTRRLGACYEGLDTSENTSEG